MGYTEKLIDFIGKSTDCYHAVKTAKDRLDENGFKELLEGDKWDVCLLYTSPSPRDRQKSRMPSSA